MKAFTDLEQSKILAEFLPIESADMYWWSSGKRYYIEAMDDGDFNEEEGHVRAWSLAALLEEIPEVINFDDDESDYELKIEKENNLYYLSYGNILEYGKLEVEPQENFVDACVAVIEELHEQNIL